MEVKGQSDEQRTLDWRCGAGSGLALLAAA
jgi:hypothetical protein